MDFLRRLHIEAVNYGACTGQDWDEECAEQCFKSISPADGRTIAGVRPASMAACERTIAAAEAAFAEWRQRPAPQRGEIVRQIGLRLRDCKQDLGALVSYEMGKSLQEGLGEVQEMIDICDFAVGQSRMLYGLSMHSERSLHRMYEQYQPLGIVGIVTAFNFPVAVWAWNAMLAAVCGDVSIWKPSSQVPLSAIAVQKIIAGVLKDNELPEGIFSLLIGSGATIGETLLHDERLPLISFTGSVPTGRHAAEVVARRLGRTLLELSGNNAIILTEHADLEVALPAVVFGAVGTAGQRCTTTRRLIVHERIYEKVSRALLKAYRGLRIGHPLDETNHVGPLIDTRAVTAFQDALSAVKEQGGHLLFGGEVLSGKGYESGCYVIPALVEAENHYPIVQQETFGPILYLIRYSGEVTEAIALQNDVRQGLSSAIFTDHLRQAEKFLAASGSDCGIANVNIGTSGAEIGGAFGGEKETGGGRESGSDAWKVYMRRQTVTINYGGELPLAQGIRFELSE
ncbi:aldehyde dehydrogenase [Syntrophotalea acetylenivorans]|uniref:aldehyde dehydrogenase (NAD(+)) n=1 Tax=Syntrophotalea acetylenivorans TaxID=1842532 RepID=A0A1L3GS91_9BACT|nr:aldehyde dehydrogenase family protein [Syntrophotalea acetylenivorans]APG28787.1 aldehyde dehydrogenase [Syntrophotalea acetylenivorans]